MRRRRWTVLALAIFVIAAGAPARAAGTNLLANGDRGHFGILALTLGSGEYSWQFTPADPSGPTTQAPKAVTGNRATPACATAQLGMNHPSG
jgi:hypothetical protein